jgi:hypothetical protein
MNMKKASVLTRQSHSRDSRPLVTFGLNENGLARFSLSKAVSVDGCGNVELRDPDDTDGDRFS